MAAHAHLLDRHADIVVAVLRAAREVAHVGIVTLGTPDWLMNSKRRFFPHANLDSVFKALDISVYHAQITKTWSSQHQDLRVLAKKNAMRKCLQAIYRGGRIADRWNVLSIGDSLVEQVAVKQICKEYPRMRPVCKSVKFADEPTLEQLSHQLELIVPNFPRLVNVAKDTDWSSTSLCFGR